MLTSRREHMASDIDATRPGYGREQLAQRGELVAPGARVDDYVVKELVAAGGCGAVYRVEHALLGREAAMKILHPDLATNDEAMVRFEREARAANIIHHPN